MAEALRRIFAYFWGSADPRTYALVRIGLSVAGLVNLVDLWPRRFAYLASTGIVSVRAIRDATGGGYYGSVFYWIGSETGVTLVLLVAAVALIALGLGVWTRAAVALVFVWHLSYSHRAFPVLHSWDAILRIYSFLVLISPTGRIWSIDHLRHPRASDGEDVPIYGLRLMQWQLIVLYVATVWLKVPDAFWRNGQMLAYFSLSVYSRNPDNLLLVHNEWLSAVETYLSLIIEISVPFLLALPRTRIVGLLAGIGLHFTIAASAKLAVFSLCMVPPYLAFLDRHDIDWFIALCRARSLGELRALIGSRGCPDSGDSPDNTVRGRCT
jgi:fatty-acid desaturase